MRKPVKQRSFVMQMLRFFFNSASKLAIAAGEFIVRNPVMTGGATAFLVVMSFVSANALWYQPEAHNAVFFPTRPNFEFKATPRPVLPGVAAATPTEKVLAEPENKGPERVSGEMSGQMMEKPAVSTERMQAEVTDDMLPALAPNADIEVARLQQRLAVLGVYKGPVDGFSGPQTRQAIDRWRALEQKVGVQPVNVPSQAEGDNSAQDEIAKAIEVAVPAPRPQAAAEPVVIKSETSAKPKAKLAAYQKSEPKNVAAMPQDKISSQDIIRVQAGLKAFGNDTVPVNGQTGKTTQAAVREFQKLFGMRVTGEIDASLIAKMREIGLIS